MTTWLFVGACLLAFCIGACVAAARSLSRRSTNGEATLARYNSRWLDAIVRATALVGLCGALCLAIDKAVLSGLDFSGGITAVRFARADAVSAGSVSDLRRSPLLYVGYLTFSFSVASYLLYMLKGELLRRSTVVLAFLTLASIFSYSYLYGGRSPLGLVVAMAVGAIVVRLLSRQSPLPKGTMGRLLFGAFLVLTVAYSNWITAERFVITGASGYSDLEQRFETTYDAHLNLPVAVTPPAPSVPAAPSASGSTRPSTSEQVLMQFAINYYYATHELPMLDRTLAYEGSLGPYYGAYQFYLPAALLSRVTPWDVDAMMLPQLKSANVYGWFSTAWGGMYLDFGLFGALAGVLLCGWLAGVAYRRALFAADDSAKLLMCYVVAGILATPILSIFTISISLPILASLAVTAFFLRAPRLRPIDERPGPLPAPSPPRN